MSSFQTLLAFKLDVAKTNARSRFNNVLRLLVQSELKLFWGFMYWLVATRLAAFQESLRVVGGEFLKCNEDALIDLAKLGDGRSITQSFNIWQHWKVRCCYLRTEKEIRKYWNACSAPLVLLFQISIWHSTTTTNDECIEVQNILQPFCLYGFKICSSPYSEFTISWKILMGIEW